MTTAARLLDEARMKSAALVARESLRAGSKMRAYEAVARRIGASSSWLRHLIGRQDGVSLPAAVMEDLRDAYTRLCERVEQRAESIERANEGDENAARTSSVATGLRESREPVAPDVEA